MLQMQVITNLFVLTNLKKKKKNERSDTKYFSEASVTVF